MVKNCWDHKITKNWKYEITDDMLEGNIFCYGKQGTKKTEKVAVPFAQAAIRMGRSCILYGRNVKEEFAHVMIEAIKSGYKLISLDVKEEFNSKTKELLLSEYAEMLARSKTVLCCTNRQFEELYSQTLLDELLNELSDIYKDNSGAHIVHIILEDLCGNMLLRKQWLENRNMRFCLTMDTRIIRKHWLREKMINMIEKAKLAPTGRLTCDAETDNYHQEVLEIFFLQTIRTVICTGADDINPKEHKTFVGSMFFKLESVKVSGRFCICEKDPDEIWGGVECPNYDTLWSHRLKARNYDEAKNFIAPDLWLIEQDGRIYFRRINSLLLPMLFYEKRQAHEWLQNYYGYGRRGELVLVEQNEEMAIYHVLDASGAVLHEFTIMQIHEDDVSKYKEQYFISILANMEDEAEFASYCEENQICTSEMTQKEKIDAMYQWHAAMRAQATEIVESDEEEDDHFEIPEEYRWKPYEAEEQDDPGLDAEESVKPILPRKGILFLGGHQNMTKKLKQIFPEWSFMSDDNLKDWRSIKTEAVFYWTKHSSHKMMAFVNSRKNAETPYLYVTATNIELLIKEMERVYQGQF